MEGSCRFRVSPRHFVMRSTRLARICDTYPKRERGSDLSCRGVCIRPLCTSGLGMRFFCRMALEIQNVQLPSTNLTREELSARLNSTHSTVSEGIRLRMPKFSMGESDIVSRRIKLEEMLMTEPNDPFLNYALALETAKEDPIGGLQRLADMNDRFPDHVPAFFRRGQILAETGDVTAARQVLTAGIAAARKTRDDHAAAEMQELLASL